jgi:hypothetical protein
MLLLSNLFELFKGGGGYVLSRKAFNTLSNQLVVNESFCQNTGTEVS